jgi:FMN phosphatase YigB (HAD superfamily)
MGVRNGKAIIFSLDVLTKAKTECEMLDTDIPLADNKTCPLLLERLNPYEIKKIADTTVLVYNACVEQAIHRDFRPPNLGSIIERALKTHLNREADYEEVNELIALISSTLNVKISKLHRAYVRALYNSGHLLGIVANLPIPANFLMEMLVKSELGGYFETIITSNDMGMLKPSQDIYKTAIASMNCDEKEVMIIGTNLDRDIKPLYDVLSQKILLTKRAKVRKLPMHILKIASLNDLRTLL